MIEVTVTASKDSEEDTIIQFVDCQRVLKAGSSTTFLVCEGRHAIINVATKENK